MKGLSPLTRSAKPQVFPHSHRSRHSACVNNERLVDSVSDTRAPSDEDITLPSERAVVIMHFQFANWEKCFPTTDAPFSPIARPRDGGRC